MTGFLQPGTSEAPPEKFRSTKIYENCQTVFEAMRSRATLEDGRVLWQGRLVNLVTIELGISTSYYTSIMRGLQNMKCVEQVRRGGGKSGLSVWELFHEPTEDAFLNSVQKNPVRYKTAQRHESIEQRLIIVENQIAKLMVTFEKMLLEDGE